MLVVNIFHKNVPNIKGTPPPDFALKTLFVKQFNLLI